MPVRHWKKLQSHTEVAQDCTMTEMYYYRFVDIFQAHQLDLSSRQGDFEAISIKAQHLTMGQTKMAQYTAQLNTRYQTLKTTMNVSMT